ncbi:MAG TPA: Type 1 glutamine amidotransferase-like domain-containing protein [Herpetosiphonaceae bacterium]
MGLGAVGRRMTGLALSLALLAGPGAPQRAGGQPPPPPRTFVPIGAGYEEPPRERFVQRVLERNGDSQIVIRVLLAPYATSSVMISPQERAQNLSDAAVRRNQIQATCERLAPTGSTCQTTVPDIQVRGDAQNPARVAELGGDVDGVYMLGGDQLVAMETLANTPSESALAALYESGKPFSGNSAGAAVQSRPMIAGYTGDNYPWHGLHFGAVDLWYGGLASVNRGLSFGLSSAVVEQHVLERGRLLRLLQAAQRSPGEQIGLGVDWGTGAVVENEHWVSKVSGAYAALVVDEETYGAGATAAYPEPWDVLSIRNVALHVLPEGPYAYGLLTRQPVISATAQPAPELARQPYPFSAPAQSFGIYLSGDFDDGDEVRIGNDFVGEAVMYGAPMLLIVTAYGDMAESQAAAGRWTAALLSHGAPPIQTEIITAGSDLEALGAKIDAAESIVIAARDQDVMAAQMPAWREAGLHNRLRARWEADRPLLLDNAAAAAAGKMMSANRAPADDSERDETASDHFLAGEVAFVPALGLVGPVAIEPRAFTDYRYGRLVSALAVSPAAERVAIGIERGSSLRLVGNHAVVYGPESIVVFDGRQAGTFETGANGAYAATWLMLDTYGPGELLIPGQRGRLFLPAVSR